jgi:hypothetical protein
MPNITVTKEYTVGSSYFFKCYDDYKIHDIDILGILSQPINGNKSFIVKLDKKDLILYPNFSKDEFIDNGLNANDPIKVGKYLNKEFAEDIGLTIEDLKRFKNLIDNLDDKHKYEKVIYESYIENGKFELTDEQRNKAYEEYKKARFN